MSNATNRHQELKAILDRLKLSGMAQHFPDLALRAAKDPELRLWPADLRERARVAVHLLGALVPVGDPAVREIAHEDGVEGQVQKLGLGQFARLRGRPFGCALVSRTSSACQFFDQSRTQLIASGWKPYLRAGVAPG